MKFAPVCPIHVYEYLDSLGPDTIGDYFLLLAHDVLANAERYNRFFANRKCTIIMDNSVIELGDACDANSLLEAAEIVNATCVAIPDVLQDGYATVRRGMSFLNDWNRLNKTKSFELMFIPQGNDLHDFVQCLEKLPTTFGQASWVGIPRNTTGRILPSRQHVTALVWTQAVRSALLNLSTPMKLHLLGFCDNVMDDIITAKLWNGYVEDIDSAVPLRLGTQGHQISTDRDFLQDAGPRGDWWETVKPELKSYLGANVIATRRIFG